MLKSNGPKVISLNLVNELFNSFGGVLSTFAGTMTSVALVSFVTQGVQPFAVMLLGILITKLFPKIEKEKITKKDIIKRTVTIIICVIGLACIEFG
jgi:dipeptide/tripeptide permease